MFSLIQLKLSLKFNSFRRLILKHSKSIFVEKNIKEKVLRVKEIIK